MRKVFSSSVSSVCHHSYIYIFSFEESVYLWIDCKSFFFFFFFIFFFFFFFCGVHVCVLSLCISQRGKARLHQPSPQLGVTTLDDSAGSLVGLRPLTPRSPELAGHLLSSGLFCASSE